MAEIAHIDAEVIKVEPSDNIGVKLDAETVINNIDDIFEREDIKQLNDLLKRNSVVPLSLPFAKQFDNCI